MALINIETLMVWQDSYGVYKEEDPTNATQQHTIVSFLQNNNSILSYLTKLLWQQGKTIALNQVIWSPNMDENTIAVALNSGTTGTTEPTWVAANGACNDNGISFMMVPIVREKASDAEATAGTNDVKIMTAAKVKTAIDAAKANTVLTGTTSVQTLTVNTALNIPGGSIWIA